MGLTTLDRVLWAVGFLGHVVLFTILVLRRRSREFPVFTTLIGFNGLKTILLYWLYESQHGSWAWYARVFYAAALIDFCLQLAVVLEIARIVMRPTGTWVEDSKKLFVLGTAAGLVLAAIASWSISVRGVGVLDLLKARGNFFTSIVICEMFVVIALTSKWLGLGLKNHVYALVLGWTSWVLSEMLVDGLHNLLGVAPFFSTVELCRKLVYLGAVLFWINRFWLNEPVAREISPELKEFIVALHKRTKNDLDSLNTQR
jgi:hypothetical protein